MGNLGEGILKITSSKRLIYTYLVYKIVTKLNDDDENNTEFVVYRR